MAKLNVSAKTEIFGFGAVVSVRTSKQERMMRDALDNNIWLRKLELRAEGISDIELAAWRVRGGKAGELKCD